MSKKNIKILISIIILMIGIIISTNVKADGPAFTVYKNNINFTTEDSGYDHTFYKGTKTRIRQHYSGDGRAILFCSQGMTNYKATLYYQDGWYKGMKTELQESSTKPDWCIEGTTMEYYKNESITDKAFAYVIATAKEQGILDKMYTQYAVWGLDINTGIHETPNELAIEGMSYKKFYDDIHGEEGFLKRNESDKKAFVGVNTEKKEYTVGGFKVNYPVGEFENKKIEETNGSEADEEQLNNYAQEKLNEMIKNSQVIYDHIKANIITNKKDTNDMKYQKNSQRNDYCKLHEDIVNYLKGNTDSTTLEQYQRDLKTAVEQLTLKNGKDDLQERQNILNTNLDNGKEIEESYKADNTNFSFISEVSVEGIDENGKSIGIIARNNLSQTDMTIIDENGSKINHNVIVNTETGDKAERNLPTSGEKFYIKFKNEDDKVKSIKVHVKITYLDDCIGTFTHYRGKWYNWEWEEQTEDINEGYCNGTYNGNTASCGQDTAHYGHDIIKTYYYWVLNKKEQNDRPQEFIGVEWNGETVDANKIYKTTDLCLTEEKPGTNLTMELGGNVFIDKDEGKVNKGDNKFDKKEALPGAEVWLYEYDNGKLGTLLKIALTDKNGEYLFTELNSQKKYYVEFYYNGMLYENVEYNAGNPIYNSTEWEKTSKANEVGREDFNEKFAEIRSYPENYLIEDKMFGNELGNYNIAYPQGDIVEIFKSLSAEVVKNGGNLEKACKEVASKYGNTEDAKRKIQFAADCRMKAQTVTKDHKIKGADATYVYPVYNKFTTTQKTAITIGGIKYNPIYDGQYYINYGMKARPTVDLSLLKNVDKAVVSINGKTETYTYGDSVYKAYVGIEEIEYLNYTRNAYLVSKEGKNWTNDKKTTNNIDVIQQKNNKLDLNIREEEARNGIKDNKSMVKKDSNDDSENYSLQENDRLDIEITYKINITNDSNTNASVTEIVDYYDKNYEFVKAYYYNNEGKEQKLETSEISRYGTSTEYKANKNQNYKTKYIIPNKQILGNNVSQEIYVVMKLKDKDKDAGQILEETILNDKELLTMNIAEINGYKTYDKNGNSDNSPGLIDIDSTPGNFNLNKVKLDGNTIKELADIQKIAEKGTKDAQYQALVKQFEDDTWKAQAINYNKKDVESRTLSGTVFEDKTWEGTTIHTGEQREGDGELKNEDKRINGVIVELYENKEGIQILRATTKTDSNGEYKFTAFLPGDYKIKFKYGFDEDTAMKNNSAYEIQGKNDTSYNGQDYQATKNNTKTYNNDQKVSGYWYKYDLDNKIFFSDATEDIKRKEFVENYSKSKYEKAIVNHKAEVFNSYETNQPDHIRQEENKLKTLVDELKELYRCADTPELEVEIEYATEEVEGNQKYAHNIQNVDFGIVERSRSELVIDQDIKNIKIVAADGVTVLFDSNGEGTTSNINWTKEKNKNWQGTQYQGGTIEGYDKNELVNVIMDEELINGAKLEVIYKFTVTNNSEEDNGATTRAKTILNYVANNLDFDANLQGNDKWEVVSVKDVQKQLNEENSVDEVKGTYVNNKAVDLSTQSVILKTKTDNPLVTKALKPRESTQEATLTLTKTLSAESTVDDLRYTNLIEIVEIENTVGRYDHGATPGNQRTDKNPQEHDAAGASRYDTMDQNTGNTPGDGDTPPDGVITITPPTGSNYIYYTIGIISTVILAAGIYLIKRYVIDRK